MSIFGFLKKKVGVEPVKAVGNILDNLFTSKDEKLSHEEVKMRILQAPTMIQNEVNKIEAQHRSIFVAGWRPFIGWVLGVSLGTYYIPQFMLASYLWIKMSLDSGEVLPYPIHDISGMTQLVTGMLGMAALRTYEKRTNTSK